MHIFVAYPYALDLERRYRDKLLRSFGGADISLTFADEHLSNKHVLDKIRDIMEDADLILFDLTGANPNVTLELGIGIAADHPYVVAIREDDVSNLNSDIHGWDQLRYVDEADLARTLIERIRNNRVPRGRAALALTSKMFEPMAFGLPAISMLSDRADIGVAIKPVSRNQILLGGLLLDPRATGRQLANGDVPDLRPHEA